jgi:hypothetical protein
VRPVSKSQGLGIWFSGRELAQCVQALGSIPKSGGTKDTKYGKFHTEVALIFKGGCKFSHWGIVTFSDAVGQSGAGLGTGDSGFRQTWA